MYARCYVSSGKVIIGRKERWIGDWEGIGAGAVEWVPCKQPGRGKRLREKMYSPDPAGFFRNNSVAEGRVKCFSFLSATEADLPFLAESGVGLKLAFFSPLP